MGVLSKRELGAQQIAKHIALFSCPICQSHMMMRAPATLACANNHSFDLAKQGYVNVMTHPATSKYSKELFESRMTIIQSGLYDALQQDIASIVKGARTILDTGCGEGSHLARICALLADDVVGVGIDIAKEGIIEAAKHYAKQIWCVGDLAKSPFQSGSFDVILNILSPANYDEFKRLLKPNGLVVKVVPQHHYLKELRVQLYADSNKEQYSNEQTVARFQESFEQVIVKRLTYTVPLLPALIPALLEMTPMAWHKDNQQNITLSEITIDVDVLIGRC